MTALGGPVTVHLGESEVWIGGAHAEWHGRAAEPGLVGLIDGDRMVLAGAVVPIVDAVEVVLGDALARSGAGRRVRLVLAHPSHWGAPRCAVLRAAAERVAAQAALVPVALTPGVARVARQGYRSGRVRCLVLELDEPATTASYVNYDGRGGSIQACEHRPGAIRTSPETFAELFAAAVPHRHIDAVLVIGPVEPDALAAIDLAVRREFPPNVDIRRVTEHDLVRTPLEPAAPAPVRPPSPPPTSARRKHYSGVLAAVTLLLVCAAAITWDRYGHKAIHGAPAAERKITLGRVTISVPVGWEARAAIAGESPNVLRLIPVDGARRRIVVSQNTLRGDPTLDEVRADLQAQRDNQGEQTTYGDIERETLGGRTILMYEQKIEANSRAKVHVIVEHGTQVSVDCQFVAGGWGAIAGACEDVVESAAVGP